MYVSLAMQILSALVAKMSRDVIADGDIELFYCKEEMYNNLADLCENWNLVVAICNGRDGPHTQENGYERQTQVLDVLSWFTDWKNMHNMAMADDNSPTTGYNFFVDKTQFCIHALILSYVGTIQIYCINKGGKLNPRNLNTDIVE